MLGLNPDEQEVVDIPNEIARKGLIYFPDFCQIVLERYRQTEAEDLDHRMTIFKVVIAHTVHAALHLPASLLVPTTSRYSERLRSGQSLIWTSSVSDLDKLEKKCNLRS